MAKDAERRLHILSRRQRILDRELAGIERTTHTKVAASLSISRDSDRQACTWALCDSGICFQPGKHCPQAARRCCWMPSRSTFESPNTRLGYSHQGREFSDHAAELRKHPQVAQANPHLLGAGHIERFRRSSVVHSQDRDESRLVADNINLPTCNDAIRESSSGISCWEKPYRGEQRRTKCIVFAC